MTEAEIEALRQAMKEHEEWQMKEWMKEVYEPIRPPATPEWIRSNRRKGESI